MEVEILLNQLRRQTDLRSRQNLGYRAALFGAVGESRKGRGIDAGYFRFRIQVNFGNAKTLTDLFQVDGGGGVDARGREAALAQTGGQRHGETPGMRCGNQLLGIGSNATFKPGGKRILPFVGAASQLHRSFAVKKIALPFRF